MADDLVTQLAMAGRTNNFCTIECRNRTPSDWNVTIIEIAAKWVFDKGSNPPDENQGKQVNITGPNGVDYLTSRNDLCVKGVWVWFKVRDGAGNEKVFDSWGEPPPPGECATYYDFVLAPKRSVRQMGAAVWERLSLGEVLAIPRSGEPEPTRCFGNACQDAIISSQNGCEVVINEGRRPVEIRNCDKNGKPTPGIVTFVHARSTAVVRNHNGDCMTRYYVVGHHRADYAD